MPKADMSFEAVAVSTWTLKGDAATGIEDYVLGLVDSVPGVSLSTNHIKHGWFKFYWKFTLIGSPIYVRFVLNEIIRAVNSCNHQFYL